MRIFRTVLFGFLLYIPFFALGQDVELYQQFNGRYDYVAIGNTLNQFENNLQDFCEILPSSQATLNLESSDNIIAAYLYWAGSGDGDNSITLNNITVNSDLTYNVPFNSGPYGILSYFSCFADITDIVLSQGNTVYELSDLDISTTLQDSIGYCENRTNFAGWSIYVIYENPLLPLNQINLFQGLEIINRNINEINIVLENLNVIDNENAKIGFLAWEGDNALNYGETLSINGNVLSNPPLNLPNNAFNGTNTFTNSNTLYNMDLDVYDIQNNIQIGDTSATITLTTGGFDAGGDFQADLIIINNMITVLNSQLPDATITLDSHFENCEKELELNYTVYNSNATDFLPANTPIAFYAGNQLIGQSFTQNDIPIGGFENGSIVLTIPAGITDFIDLKLVVDDDGSQNGIITETDETNNFYEQQIELLPLPTISILPTVIECNEGFDSAVFNLIEAVSDNIDPSTIISFYENIEDLENDINELSFPEEYSNISNPQTIYLKVEEDPCYTFYQFDIMVENCPPYVPQGFSPNGDNKNDWFNIQGLYDIFLNHELIIYNRYGIIVFEGNNSKPWDGHSNKGLNNIGNLMPVGTYFYILYLNDPNYEPLQGWVYLNY